MSSSFRNRSYTTLLPRGGPGNALSNFILFNPLLFAAFAMVGGIAVEQRIGQTCIPVVFLLGAILALGLGRRLPAAFCLIFFAAASLLRAEQQSFQRARMTLPPDGQTVEFTGVIGSFPLIEKERAVIRVKVTSLSQKPVPADAAPTVELRIYSSVLEPSHFFLEHPGTVSEVSPPLPGDQVRFWGDLRNAAVFQNPGRLWLERRLMEQRVHGVVILKSPWLLDYRSQDVAWKQIWLTWRKSNLLKRYWPDGSPASAFINALLWGERYGLPQSFVVASQATGVYHLLVVSGMHFALILASATWIARRLSISFTMRAGLFATLSLVLLTRTEMGPSVTRAFLVAICLVVAEWLWRKGNSLNFVGGAALLILCCQPLTLFNPGFQFSFLCCVVLICVGPAVLDSLVYPQAALQQCWRTELDLRKRPPSRDARALRFRAEAFLEMHRNLQCCYWIARIPLFCLMLISRWLVIAFLIQNETLLLSAFHSNQGLGPALLANLVLLPVTSLVVLGGLLLSVSPVSLRPLAWLVGGLVDFCYSAVYWFERWSWPDHPQPTAWLLLLLIVIIGIQIVIRSCRQQQILVLALFLVNSGWALFASESRVSQPGIYFFDVGQGDSAAVMDEAGSVILIDAGTFSGIPEQEGEYSEENPFLARNVLSRALWELGARKIEGIFVSHLHEDHVSAVPRLARNLGEPPIYLSRASVLDPLFPGFAKKIPERIQLIYVSEGDSFRMAGATVEVLHPPKKAPSFASNENSMVLRIRNGGRIALFTGDMTRREESTLAGRVGAVDILKVAHHGSLSSTSTEWLAELRPSLALISCGRRNRFDHPHPAVLQRLTLSGARVHRTDEKGFLFVPP